MHTYVTPLAGVWIEILWEYARENGRLVTPLAGVWIEIFPKSHIDKQLKIVTPLAGVWIEIPWLNRQLDGLIGHSPCGSVD